MVLKPVRRVDIDEIHSKDLTLDYKVHIRLDRVSSCLSVESKESWRFKSKWEDRRKRSTIQLEGTWTRQLKK